MIQRIEGRRQVMTTKLYETDFAQWAVAQADHLRNEEYADLDLNNLIEEIESMGASQRSELHKRLMRILEHMLKITCEPESSAVGKWQKTILTQRLQLAHLLKTNYTLRSQIDTFVDDAYQAARLLAAAGSVCVVEDFSASCPWPAEQLLDLNFSVAKQ